MHGPESAQAAQPLDVTAACRFNGMAWIPGGTFRRGSDRHYPEEAPVQSGIVDGFWIDRVPVTNAEFHRFVRATGYVTFAEIAPRASDYPGARAEMLRAGSVGVHAAEPCSRSQRLGSMAAIQVRRLLAAALRPAQLDRRDEPS